MKFFLMLCLLISGVAQATQPDRRGGWPENLNDLTDQQFRKVANSINANGYTTPSNLGDYHFMSFKRTVGAHAIVAYTAYGPCAENGRQSTNSFMLILYVEGQRIKQVNGSANFGCQDD